MLQIGVAIVGYGYWGPNLARNFYELSTCRLSAVCDQDVTRLAEAERLYPSALFIKDYQDIFWPFAHFLRVVEFNHDDFSGHHEQVMSLSS